MKKIFIALALILSFVFGAETDDSGMTEWQQKKLLKIFGVKNNQDTSGTCSFHCLEPVDSAWGTQITGIDLLNGITHCAVFRKDDVNQTINIDAGTVNNACLDKLTSMYPKDVDPILSSNKVFTESQISRTHQENGVTLARFLAGIVTLDPNIINRDYAATTGSGMLANGKVFYGTNTTDMPSAFSNNNNNLFINKNEIDNPKDIINSIIDFFKRPQDTITVDRQLVVTADDFNKQNIAYYSNLFKGMGIVYNHLQNLLFIVVGGFFMSGLLGKKLQVYLENKGSNPSPNGEAYLHRFFIPLIATAFFFVPISEGYVSGDATNDGKNIELSATAVQKIIRYFTGEASDIADMASAIGANNYMNKIYKTVGGIDAYGKANIEIALAQSKFQIEEATKIYKKCTKRWVDINNDQRIPDVKYFGLSDLEKEQYLSSFIDKDKVSGTQNDISIAQCVSLSGIIAMESNKLKTYQKQLEAIEKYKNNTDLQTRLRDLDSYIQNRETELGWFNSTILPGTALMVEMQSYIKDNAQQSESDGNPTGINTNASMEQAIKEIQNSGGSLGSEATENFAKTLMSNALGRVGWLMLPGSSTLMNFINDGLRNGTNLAVGSAGSLLSLTQFDKLFKQGTFPAQLLTVPTASVSKVISFFIPATSAIVTSVIMEYIVEKIPVLVATVAAGLAFIGYLVALAKYFYISPFVVAFALTTRRVDRIVEFLVTGVTIFFRPILIVLFIYLALFFHSFIKDVFLVFSAEQFGGLKAAGSEPMAWMLIELAKGLLKVFAYIASAYVMWKTILGGPDWTFRLMGINNSSSDVITEDVGRRMESKTFMV
ncbi:hypothetical protein FV933_08200 [Campylobacter jejuni]|nr:hypothetical protein [Campylobacter jejuni]